MRVCFLTPTTARDIMAWGVFWRLSCPHHLFHAGHALVDDREGGIGGDIPGGQACAPGGDDEVEVAARRTRK